MGCFVAAEQYQRRGRVWCGSTSITDLTRKERRHLNGSLIKTVFYNVFFCGWTDEASIHLKGSCTRMFPLFFGLPKTHLHELFPIILLYWIRLYGVCFKMPKKNPRSIEENDNY